MILKKKMEGIGGPELNVLNSARERETVLITPINVLEIFRTIGLLTF